MILEKDQLLKCIDLCIESFDNKKRENKTLFNIGNCQGFFLKEDYFYIVFRGTDSLIDWIYDFDFKQIEIPYTTMSPDSKIKVHSGFIDMYRKVKSLINNEAIKRNNIIITGHSLGAALATLCALDIQKNFIDKNISCVPMSSPRVGNKYFVDSFNRRIPDTYRLWYRNDLVPRIPYKFLGYEHVRGNIHLGMEDKDFNILHKLLGNRADHDPMLLKKAIIKYYE